MNSIYPKGIGLKLNKDNFPYNPNFAYLKPDKKTIIRVYGLSGVGKGKLCSNISTALNIPNLDTGKVFRSVCYAYLALNLDTVTTANTETAFKSLIFKLSQNHIQVFFGKKELQVEDLKNSKIDSKIADYSKDPNLRQKTYDVILDFILQKVDTACITDARGASEDYIDKAEKLGYKIIRILVDVDFETKLARYYEEMKYLEERKKGRSLRAPEREGLYKHLWEVMRQRDDKDLAISKSGQWLLITEDSAILYTGLHNIQESFKLAISYIASKCEK